MLPEIRYTVLIASYLEPEHVERIRQVDTRLDVIYEPELLAAPRYPADHYRVPDRSPEQAARWRQLLGRADILFDFDFSHRQDLPELAPRVRWIQATSAGIGQSVKRLGYDQHMCGACPTFWSALTRPAPAIERMSASPACSATICGDF